MIGGYETSLSNVSASYALFERDEFDIDFLIMGPGLVYHGRNSSEGNQTS